MLRDIGLPLSSIQLYYDNMGVTQLAANPVFHARTKHIEVSYHFIRDLVSKGFLTIRCKCIYQRATNSTFLFLSVQAIVDFIPISLRGRIREIDINVILAYMIYLLAVHIYIYDLS